MNTVNYHLVDVFTETRFGGNQLAVFPDGSTLDPREMQQIARELNLSETAFVIPRSHGDPPWVRIFTPAAELGFAGHPTIGTAAVLSELARRDTGTPARELTFAEGLGRLNEIPLRITPSEQPGGVMTASFDLNTDPEQDPMGGYEDHMAKAIGLKEKEIGNSWRWSMEAWSAGVPFWLVPIKTLDAVRRAKLNITEWEKHYPQEWAKNIYLFAEGGEGEGVSFHARMFAPALGVPEDPATGAAACALAARLSHEGKFGSYRIEQGLEMGRPSLLNLTVGDQFRDGFFARLSGSVVFVGEGRISL